MKKKYFLQEIVLGMAVIGFLLYYLINTVGPLPLMDWWREVNPYFEEYIIGEGLYFKIFPHSIQWNPLMEICNYVFIHYFAANNLVYTLVAIIPIMGYYAVLMAIYRKYCITNNKCIDLAGKIILILILVNLNQWEIMTLYCSYAFYFRLFCFILTFYLLDEFITAKKRILKKYIIFIGCISMFFWGQAYILPFYITILLVMFYTCWQKKDGIFLRDFKDIALAYTSVAIIYAITLDFSDNKIGSATIVDMATNFCMAINVMMSAIIMHSNYIIKDIELASVLGNVLCISTILGIYRVIKHAEIHNNVVSIMCITYALLNMIIIIYGRMSVFGIEGLAASRYVTETTFLLIGLFIIYWKDIINKNNIVINMMILCFIVVNICFSTVVEIKMSPYRSAYYQEMVKRAYNIENISDEDLLIFQCEPHFVREDIAIMKKYRINIFK